MKKFIVIACVIAVILGCSKNETQKSTYTIVVSQGLKVKTDSTTFDITGSDIATIRHLTSSYILTTQLPKGKSTTINATATSNIYLHLTIYKGQSVLKDDQVLDMEGYGQLNAIFNVQ